MIEKMDRRLVLSIGYAKPQPPNVDRCLQAEKLVDLHCQGARFGIHWDLIQPDNPNQWLWGQSFTLIDTEPINPGG